MGTSSWSQQQPVKKGTISGLKKLIGKTESDNEDDDLIHHGEATTSDPSKSWWLDFNHYVETSEAKLPAGMSTIQWWGVSFQKCLSSFRSSLQAHSLPQINAERYTPVWTLIAHDHYPSWHHWS